MSQKPPRRSVLHQLFSVLTRKVPEQAKQQVQALPRPAPDDRDAWHAYWEAQGQPWRTEPEIDEPRKRELEACRSIQPDNEKGVYPFGDMKLKRADIEWLLATHENGRGPIDWNDESQRNRKGLDLRGANLQKEDLSALPLTCLRGGLAYTWEEWQENITSRQAGFRLCCSFPAINLAEAQLCGTHLEGANLFLAHLEGANLRSAHVERLDLRLAYLQGADLAGVNLEGVNLFEASLERANLSGASLLKAKLKGARLFGACLNGARLAWANLEGADLRETSLEGADLNEIHLERANLGSASLKNAVLYNAHLEGAILNMAHLEGAMLQHADLKDATLVDAHLEEARLGEAHLERAWLILAHLEKADLTQAHLQGAFLSGAYLERARLDKTHLEYVDLSGAYLDAAVLSEAILTNESTHVGPSLADVHWGDTTLSVIDWSEMKMIGEEHRAHLKKKELGKEKSHEERLHEYQCAARGSQQLGVALQGQGLNEEAARFAYRAQILQKQVRWLQMTQRGIKVRQRVRALGPWLFSWFLFLLAGYGYKLWRSFLAYLLIISLFMTFYHMLDPRLAWNEALVVSMTAFHGRGFSPSTFSPGDALSLVSAVEAFVGLIIEVTFIATLTRRFFGQ